MGLCFLIGNDPVEFSYFEGSLVTLVADADRKTNFLLGFFLHD